MSAFLLKLTPRIPELIARALAGDVTAAATLAAMGIAAGAEILKQNS